MDILLTIHHELDVSAGAPGVTLKLADAFRRRGHTVTVFSFSDMTWLHRRLRALLFPWAVFVHVLGHPGYDVLDCSSGDNWVVNRVRRWTGWRPRQLSATRSHGLEQLVHEHIVGNRAAGTYRTSWKYPLYWGGYRLWECRQSFALADVLLMLSQLECDYAVEHFGVDTTRTALLGNGIDACFSDAARRALATPVSDATRARNIAFVGRAAFWKGFPYLCDAMAALLARYPDVRLGLFGTGASAQQVLDAFAPTLHARISVMPRYDNAELPQLLGDYQILAFPSVAEGSPVAPLEAMACGLVPVISDLPGTRVYMRDGENGVLIPPQDAAALERELAALLDDGERWLALRRGALNTALHYAWDDLAARFELLYCRHRQRVRRAGAGWRWRAR